MTTNRLGGVPSTAVIFSVRPSFVITHTAPLEKGPELYKTFRDKEDGCIKVVLKPGMKELQMADNLRKLAIVTGASTGIGLELARECAKNNFELIIAANEPEIESAADELRREGGTVEAVQADLATIAGVDKLYSKVKGRPVAALLANAGRGLGKAFLDQEFDDARYVLDTNVTGTLYLIHKVGRDMRARGEGRILITGSIAGFMPGSYHAVYNGTKAFLDSFARRSAGPSDIATPHSRRGAKAFGRRGILNTSSGISQPWPS